MNLFRKYTNFLSVAFSSDEYFTCVGYTLRGKFDYFAVRVI